MEKADGIFWAYVPENSEGRFYVGSTSDPDRRLGEHNDSGGGPAEQVLPQARPVAACLERGLRYAC
ncbi:MAG: GIY-YIG nuclease family protein [Phycisphaerales bacterium]|nr:MAG: GIY-YIG nuclease family protein [Phycisphaerales bacterium]